MSKNHLVNKIPLIQGKEECKWENDVTDIRIGKRTSTN